VIWAKSSWNGDHEKACEALSRIVSWAKEAIVLNEPGVEAKARRLALPQLPPPRVKQAAADAITARHVRRRRARVQALQSYRAFLLRRPNTPPVAAGDELHPTALCTPTTLRTSAIIIDLELGQPDIIHRPFAARSAEQKECGAAAPLTPKSGLEISHLLPAITRCPGSPAWPRRSAPHPAGTSSTA